MMGFPMHKITNLIPKSPSDCLAFLFFMFGIFMTVLLEVTFVIPRVHGWSSVWPYVHYTMCIFILHNIMGNLYYVITTENTIRKVMLPSSAPNNQWRYCCVCEANCPPRSFHCPTCEVCTLRRDHHCIFAGVCIGYFNYRFYMGLLLSLSFGCVYASILNNHVVWSLLGGVSGWNVLCHTFPVFLWMLGHLPYQLAVFCVVCMIDLCGFLFAIGLFFYHFQLLIKNQTTYERTRRDLMYDLRCWKTNLAETLGNNWQWTWLSPFVSSPFPRNGIDFPTYEMNRVEGRKHR